MTYTVKPRVIRLLWFQPRIVFDVWQSTEVWDDPTYDNGGGEWVLAQKKFGSYHCEKTANEICNKLNDYGEKK